MLKPSRRKKRARGSLARAAERRSVPCTTRAGSASPSQGFAADSVTVIALLAGATVGLMSLIFAPISVWPLAFVCLVPWLLVVSTSNNPRRVYVASFGVGLAFHLINMWWLSHVTVPGYVVWSAGIALYFPLMACPLRHWVRRRRMPLAIGLPIIWIACECVRAWMLTGFPWFFLAHSQYRFLTLIQISDLFGAYAVSFVVAAVNGAIVDVLLPRLGGTGEAAPGVTRRPAFSRWVGPAFAATLLLATLVYGTIQLRRDTTSSGPRVAVIQGDYPLFVDVDRNRKRADEKMARYMELMREAQAAGEEPDLFLLPETPWRMLLNREFLELEPAELAPAKRLSLQWSRRCADFFQAWAEEMNATVVTGAFSTVLTPLNLRAEERNYNSAFMFAPDGSPTGYAL